jgi:hypothetical protein
VVLLRKSIPQNRNLKAAAELNVKNLSFFAFLLRQEYRVARHRKR